MISFINVEKCQPVWFSMIYGVVAVQMCLSPVPACLPWSTDINTNDDQICLLAQYQGTNLFNYNINKYN